MNATYRYWIFAAGAALTLASCRQDTPALPTQSGDATVITFNSPYTVDSRSNAMRGGNFKEGDKVGVLGYCIASNPNTDVDVDYSTSPWDTKKPFCTPDVFYNQELTYSGTGMWDYKWSGSFDGEGAVGDLHPWSSNEDDTFSFFAYYPYAPVDRDDRKATITIDNIEMGEIELSGDDERGDPTITYTMPHGGANSLTSTLNWWEVPDFMLAYKTDHYKRDGSVKLEFRHLFCAFEFVINNYNLKPVTIEDFYIHGGATVDGTKDGDPLSGFYKSLTVTGQQNDYSVGDDIYIGRFKLVGRTSTGEDEHILESFTCDAATEDANGNVIPKSKYITYPPESEDSEDAISLLFIPDQFGKLTSEGNKDIRLSLNIRQGEQTVAVEERTMNLENVSFQSGVRSIFNINIIGNDFYIQMRSDGSWDDGGESDIVFE